MLREEPTREPTGVRALAYVSDLHAAYPCSDDRLAARAALFGEFRKSFANPIRTVGDWIDSGHVLEHYPVFSLPKGVRGNTDYKSGLPSYRWDGRVLCAHGHQAYPFRFLGVFSRSVAEKRRPSVLDEKAFGHYVSDNLSSWVCRVLHRENPVVLVHGHTHRPGLLTLPCGTVVADCGSWEVGNPRPTAVLVFENSVRLVGVVS